jgi:hypothetical protein
MKTSVIVAASVGTVVTGFLGKSRYYLSVNLGLSSMPLGRDTIVISLVKR